MELADLPDIRPWRPIEKLGEGGQCAVFRASRDDGSPERAVKVLLDRSPDAARRFIDEAELLSTLAHPNILRVHEIAADAKPPWVVLELLGGEDLDDALRRQAFEPERAARIVADVASGLAAVHARGIRHRDIKPSNIMLGQDGVPRLIDFGIAREITKAHLTQAGMVIGTVAYLPPELFASDDQAAVQDSEASDVYALGQTLFEMLVGEPTYPREGSQTRLLAMVMRLKLEQECLDPRTRRTGVPDGLAAIVRAATAQEPESRIATAEALEQALRKWLIARQDVHSAPVARLDPKQLTPPPRPPPPPPPPDVPPDAEVPMSPHPSPPPRSNALLWLMSGMGSLFVAGGGILVTMAAAATLYVARPAHRPVPPEEAASTVRGMLAQQAHVAAVCGQNRPAGRPVTATVEFRVERGWSRDVSLEGPGTGDPAVDACLVQAVQSMVFGGAPDAEVRAPLSLP